MNLNLNWLMSAICTILEGTADKLQKENVTVYRVKNIIRIDIKEEK